MEWVESVSKDPADELPPHIGCDGVEPLPSLRKTLLTVIPLDPPQADELIESTSKGSDGFHLSKVRVCFEGRLVSL